MSKKSEPNRIAKVILAGRKLRREKLETELAGERKTFANPERVGRKSWCHNGARREIRASFGRRKNGIRKLYISSLCRPQDFLRNFLSAHFSGLRRESKFPYLHHQPRCTVDEPRRCRRASSRWTDAGEACARPSTSTDHDGVAGCSSGRVGASCARNCRCCESWACRGASSSDGAAWCRWYDCACVVTSCMAVRGDPSTCTTRWGDIPVTPTTTLLLGERRWRGGKVRNEN